MRLQKLGFISLFTWDQYLYLCSLFNYKALTVNRDCPLQDQANLSEGMLGPNRMLICMCFIACCHQIWNPWTAVAAWACTPCLLLCEESLQQRQHHQESTNLQFCPAYAFRDLRCTTTYELGPQNAMPYWPHRGIGIEDSWRRRRCHNTIAARPERN